MRFSFVAIFDAAFVRSVILRYLSMLLLCGVSAVCAYFIQGFSLFSQGQSPCLILGVFSGFFVFARGVALFSGFLDQCCSILASVLFPFVVIWLSLREGLNPCFGGFVSSFKII
jgi:hypothetical protein